MKRLRLLLADEHKMFSDCLRLFLEPDTDVIGTVADGERLIATAERLRPDLILMEITLPRISGIEAAQRLRYSVPEAKIIFLAASAEMNDVLGGLRAGGSGYLVKNCRAMELQSAIKEVMRGRVFVTPLVKEYAAKHTASSVSTLEAPHDLTEREKVVLQLVAEGLSARDIGAILKISLKTVAFHKTNIKHKLSVRSTAGLTKYALRHGVIS
jgi:DNA-binding NarL/FixJ family response regulator